MLYSIYMLYIAQKYAVTNHDPYRRDQKMQPLIIIHFKSTLWNLCVCFVFYREYNVGLYLKKNMFGILKNSVSFTLLSSRLCLIMVTFCSIVFPNYQVFKLKTIYIIHDVMCYFTNQNISSRHL